MRKKKMLLIAVCASLLLNFCDMHIDNDVEDNGKNNTVAPSRWAEAIHVNYTYIAATKLGLTSNRVGVMAEAADNPDYDQSGWSNFYNQQWSHAFILTENGNWLWGDADDDFHDNINKAFLTEGYDGRWAGYYYERGNRNKGDWYVGYASHYIQDINLFLHTSFPSYDMAAHHFDYETWVQNNWTTGHNFSQTANGVSAANYYVITDLKKAIRNAAKYSNINNSNGITRNIWNNYKQSGFPTATGSGNSSLVYYTQIMVKETVKWTGGAIKYALNKYNQW